MPKYYAPDFEVRIQGLTVAADVRQSVLELTYDNHLDQADMFSLRLADPQSRFIDSPLFAIGNRVEIHLGYVGQLRPVMLGEVAALEPSFGAGASPTLTITGYDKSYRMRHNTPSRMTFKFMNDSAIAGLIALENLLIPAVDPSPLPPRESVQQTGSDWALLSELAERNFFEVFVSWDKLVFRAPRPQTEMVVLEWGRNLVSFSPRFATATQAGIQVIRGFNQELAQSIVMALPAIAAGAGMDEIIERLGGNFVQQLASLGRRVARNQAVESPLDAAILAKSLLQQLLEGIFEGTGTCLGIPELRAGDLVEIRGVGKRFSGAYKLRQVTHSIGDDGYQTKFEVSRKHSGTLLETLREKIVESPPPVRQEKIEGLVIGKVENNIDPKGLGRVQVSFPHLSDANLSHWAPLASPSAGDDSGAYFLPDLGAEVVVGFLHGDVNRPLVLGQLWSLLKPPPVRHLDGQNRVRVIRTKAGHQIKFDDTPAAEKVVIEDAAGNTITLAGGPRPVLEVKAAGDLSLSGGNIELQAANEIKMGAVNVKVKVSGVMDVS